MLSSQEGKMVTSNIEEIKKIKNIIKELENSISKNEKALKNKISKSYNKIRESKKELQLLLNKVYGGQGASQDTSYKTTAKVGTATVNIVSNHLITNNKNYNQKLLSRQTLNLLFIYLDTLHDFFEGRGKNMKNKITNLLTNTSINSNNNSINVRTLINTEIAFNRLITVENGKRTLGRYMNLMDRIYYGNISELNLEVSNIKDTANKDVTELSIIKILNDLEQNLKIEKTYESMYKIDIYKKTNLNYIKIWFFYYELYKQYNSQKVNIINSSFNSNLQQNGMTYTSLVRYLTKYNMNYTIDIGQGVNKVFLNSVENQVKQLLYITAAQIIDSSKFPIKRDNIIKFIIRTDSVIDYNNKANYIKRIFPSTGNFVCYRQVSLYYNTEYQLNIYTQSPFIQGKAEYEMQTTIENIYNECIIEIKNDFACYIITNIDLSEGENHIDIKVGKDNIKYYKISVGNTIKNILVNKGINKGGLSVNSLSDIFKGIALHSDNMNMERIIRPTTENILRWCVDIKRCGDSFQHKLLEKTQNKSIYPILSSLYILTYDYLSAAYGLYTHRNLIVNFGRKGSFFIFQNRDKTGSRQQQTATPQASKPSPVQPSPGHSTRKGVPVGVPGGVPDGVGGVAAEAERHVNGSRGTTGAPSAGPGPVGPGEAVSTPGGGVTVPMYLQKAFGIEQERLLKNIKIRGIEAELIKLRKRIANSPQGTTIQLNRKNGTKFTEKNIGLILKLKNELNTTSNLSQSIDRLRNLEKQLQNLTST